MLAEPLLVGDRVRMTRHVQGIMKALSHEILTGIREWRQQHPKATLREIELALDERLAPLRARMLRDVALQSLAADGNAPADAERRLCAVCGTQLRALPDL